MPLEDCPDPIFEGIDEENLDILMEEDMEDDETYALLAEEHVELFIGAFEVSEEFAQEIRAQWAGHAWQFDPYFDPQEIDDSRGTEMVRLARYDSFAQLNADDYDGEIVECRWVDQERQVGLRSRIVCKDFRTGPSNETLFAGTPDSVVFRYFFPELGSDRQMCAVVTDAVSAFSQSSIFRVDEDDRTAVNPPEG